MHKSNSDCSTSSSAEVDIDFDSFKSKSKSESSSLTTETDQKMASGPLLAARIIDRFSGCLNNSIVRFSMRAEKPFAFKAGQWVNRVFVSSFFLFLR